jgi:hypothetical protein
VCQERWLRDQERLSTAGVCCLVYCKGRPDLAGSRPYLVQHSSSTSLALVRLMLTRNTALLIGHGTASGQLTAAA